MRKNKMRKFVIWYAVFFIVFSILATATIALAASPYVYPEPRDPDKASIMNGMWRTEHILGDLPPDTPPRLYEKYPETLHRYSLDYVIEYNSKQDDVPWWRRWWSKLAEQVSNWVGNAFEELTNKINNMIFGFIKIPTMISIAVIQLAMGGEWMAGLISLFGAITKVIGISFLAQNLFYVSMICLGVYLIYQGLIKRRLGTTISETLLSLFLLAFSVVFISNPTGVIRGINDTTDALGIWIMQIGMDRGVMDEIAETERNDAHTPSADIRGDVSSPTIRDLKKMAIVDISNKLWALQVHAPWEVLQFGTIDIDMSNPTRSTGKIVMTQQEFEFLKELLDDINLEISVAGDGGIPTPQPASQVIVQAMESYGVKPVQPGTLAGVPWSTLLLSIPSENDALRSAFVFTLAANNEEYGKYLYETDNKFFYLLIIMITNLAITWFILFIAAGMFIAQILLLVSMVIGPFVLIGSAIPQFGHRYVKNWALITLGACGAKLMYYVLMSVSFLLMSVIMTVAYNMDSLDLDNRTKSDLAFFQAEGPASLTIVNILILIVFVVMNMVRKKLFARHENVGQFGLAGQIIHNLSRGKPQNIATMYGRAMRGESYGDLVYRDNTTGDGAKNPLPKWHPDTWSPWLNPLNLVGRNPAKKSNTGSGGGGGGGGSPADSSDTGYANISNHPALKDNKYLRCPKNNEPCIAPQVGMQNLGPCPKFGKCPYHVQGDKNFGKQYSNIRSGADKYLKPTASGGGSPGNGNVVPSQTGKPSSTTLPCPVDNSACTNSAVAFGGNTSPHCSVKGCLCPYRNIAQPDYYNYMQRLKSGLNVDTDTRTVRTKEDHTPTETDVRTNVKPEVEEPARNVPDASSVRLRIDGSDVRVTEVNPAPPKAPPEALPKVDDENPTDADAPVEAQKTGDKDDDVNFDD